MRKIFLPVVIIFIILTLVIVSFFIYNKSQVNNMFIKFESSEAVHEFLAHDYKIGQTRKDEIEQQLKEGRLGSVYCIPSLTLEEIGGSASAIICEALASNTIIFPRLYVMIFDFENEILSAIEVDTSVNAP